jgi:aspartate kinase
MLIEYLNTSMTDLIVQKFGGTSVANLDRIEKVAEIIKSSAENNDVVVVISAMAGETDRLFNLGQKYFNQDNVREMDALLSTGEVVSSSLLAMCLSSLGLKAKSFNASQLKLMTKKDSSNKFATILSIDTALIKNEIAQGVIPIITGFQGVDEKGDFTTLGRGGSDTTAVAVAAELKAKECQIYTDVKGVFSADPNKVNDARVLECVTSEEMLELSGQGAKVLALRSVELGHKYKVPIKVLSSFEQSQGTKIIYNEPTDMEESVVTSITSEPNQAKFTIYGGKSSNDFSASVLNLMAQKNIFVDVIVMNYELNGAIDFSFTVQEDNLAEVESILKEYKGQLFDDYVSESDLSKISVVGVGMRSQTGVASRVFSSLEGSKTSLKLVSTSEIKITLVLESCLEKMTVESLHREFFK